MLNQLTFPPLAMRHGGAFFEVIPAHDFVYPLVRKDMQLSKRIFFERQLLSKVLIFKITLFIIPLLSMPVTHNHCNILVPVDLGNRNTQPDRQWHIAAVVIISILTLLFGVYSACLLIVYTFFSLSVLFADIICMS